MFLDLVFEELPADNGMSVTPATPSHQPLAGAVGPTLLPLTGLDTGLRGLVTDSQTTHSYFLRADLRIDDLRPERPPDL